jgi:hypothetical protein
MKKPNKQKKVMRIQARFTIDEWREIEKKAHLFTDGNFSRWLRLAAISYKPLK